LGNLSKHLQAVESLRVHADGNARHSSDAGVMDEADVVLLALAGHGPELLDGVAVALGQVDSLGHIAVELLDEGNIVIVE